MNNLESAVLELFFLVQTAKGLRFGVLLGWIETKSWSTSEEDKTPQSPDPNRIEMVESCLGHRDERA